MSNNLKGAIKALKNLLQPAPMTLIVDFGKNDYRKDEYFQQLLAKSFNGELICRKAIVKMKAIEPLTNYKPEISQGFRQHFFGRLTEEDVIPLYVYQKNGKFIMSDDYNSYSLYKEMGVDIAPCIVVGEIADTKDVTEVGKPFRFGEASMEIVVEKVDSVKGIEQKNLRRVVGK